MTESLDKLIPIRLGNRDYVLALDLATFSRFQRQMGRKLLGPEMAEEQEEGGDLMLRLGPEDVQGVLWAALRHPPKNGGFPKIVDDITFDDAGAMVGVGSMAQAQDAVLALLGPDNVPEEEPDPTGGKTTTTETTPSAEPIAGSANGG